MSFGKLLLGALLVGVGVVLLGTSLGYLSDDVWPSLVQYWPLLLVAIGIAFLARAIQNRFLGWVAAVLVMGGLIFGAWWLTSRKPQQPKPGTPFSINLAKTRVNSVTFRGRALLGRIEVGTGRDTVRAIRLQAFHVPIKMTETPGWTVSGRAGILDWPAREGTGGIAPIGGELRVGFPPRTAVRLDLRAHLSRLDADLRSLHAERAGFRAIGSLIRVVASDLGGPQRIRIEGALSNVSIRLPANAPVRVVYSRWFGLRRMPADFLEHLHGRSRDRIYRSEGRGASILVEIDGPLLRVDIERAPVKAVELAAGARGLLAAAPTRITP